MVSRVEKSLTYCFKTKFIYIYLKIINYISIKKPKNKKN